MKAAEPCVKAAGSGVQAEKRKADLGRAGLGELDGQTSINAFLDELIGVTSIQMPLPILVQVGTGVFRRLS